MSCDTLTGKSKSLKDQTVIATAFQGIGMEATEPKEGSAGTRMEAVESKERTLNANVSCGVQGKDSQLSLTQGKAHRNDVAKGTTRRGSHCWLCSGNLQGTLLLTVIQEQANRVVLEACVTDVP